MARSDFRVYSPRSSVELRIARAVAQMLDDSTVKDADAARRMKLELGATAYCCRLSEAVERYTGCQSRCRNFRRSLGVSSSRRSDVSAPPQCPYPYCHGPRGSRRSTTENRFAISSAVSRLVAIVIFAMIVSLSEVDQM